MEDSKENIHVDVGVGKVIGLFSGIKTATTRPGLPLLPQQDGWGPKLT